MNSPSSEQIVYRNPWLHVAAEGTMHSVTTGTGFGSVVVPFNTNASGNRPRFALVRQYRHALGETTLEFPRGGTDDLESDEAARELAEETGITSATLRRLGTIYPDTGMLTTHVATWIAVTRGDDVPQTHVEEETGAELVWMSAGEIAAAIRSGQIRCAMTISAWLHAQDDNAVQLAHL